MRSSVTAALLRRLSQIPVVDDALHGARLSRPIDLRALMVTYAEAMAWPKTPNCIGGDGAWRWLADSGDEVDVAAALLDLDDVPDSAALSVAA